MMELEYVKFLFILHDVYVPAAFLTRDGGCGGSCMKQSALRHFLILAQEYLQDPVNTTRDTMQMVNG
jgi:hypothetical protein